RMINSPVDAAARSSQMRSRIVIASGGARKQSDGNSIAGGPTMTTIVEARESGFKTNPDYKITFEPSPRRVRVKFNGETIADSTHAHLLFETRHLPVYYFPRSDVRLDLMTPTDPHRFCPYKGHAPYWTIRVGDQ